MSQTTQAPPATDPARGRRVKRVVVGRPTASDELGETLLSKSLALPIFAVRPALLGRLRDRGGAGRPRRRSVDRARTSSCRSRSRSPLCSAIVVLSYTQTVQAYETSGGAYVVAKENLGTLPSLVAAAALLVDYVLTVAVSVAAGVLAITSAAPSLARAQGRALARLRRCCSRS